MSKEIADLIIQKLKADENREITIIVKDLIIYPPLYIKARRNDFAFKVLKAVKDKWNMNYDMFVLSYKGKRITLDNSDVKLSDLGVDGDVVMCCIYGLRGD